MADTAQILSILFAAATTMAGLFLTTTLRAYLAYKLRKGRRELPSYGERLSSLVGSLSKATREVDDILSELAGVARAREASVHVLQANLVALQGQERELRQQVELLQKTPVPVAEHFAKLVETGERRSARRDYVLFGAGVLVTTLIAILIQLFMT